MRVAVLSLCRDRLPYTQHCFGRLLELAGCPFDHLILDQGSEDGTAEWLKESYPFTLLYESPRNLGIHRGFNMLLEGALELEPDVIVMFDNDCELVTAHALAQLAMLSLVGNAVLAPRILGLRQPPPTIGEFTIDGSSVSPKAVVDEVQILGAICRAAPASFFADGFRFDESLPVHSGDEQVICNAARAAGMGVGYVQGLFANHYLTTDGQVADIPWYFERRVSEGGRAR